MQVETPQPPTSPVGPGSVAAATAAPVLHISYVKSGSYLLWTVLDRMFRVAGCKRSFVQRHSVQSQRERWPDFSIDQFDIDQMLVLDDGAYWQIETQHIEAIGDLKGYLAACSHVWTHSYLCYRSWEVYPQFARRCYVVRDPRDALVSMAHFVQTPFMRRYHPHPAASPDGYVELELTKFLEDWCRHVGEHARASRALDIKLLQFEDMRADLGASVTDLASWMAMPLSDRQIGEVVAQAGFGSMRKRNPQHVRKGASGGYAELLSAAQCTRALEIAGSTMRELGYEV